MADLMGICKEFGIALAIGIGAVGAALFACFYIGAIFGALGAGAYFTFHAMLRIFQ